MRRFTGRAKALIWCLGAAFTVFQLYTVATRPLAPLVQYPLVVGWALVLVFLLYPPVRGRDSRGFLALDIALSLVVVAFSLRLVLTGGDISTEETLRLKWSDWLFSVANVILILEAGRRTLGIILPLVAVVFMVYAFGGPAIPGVMGHQGIGLGEFLANNYLHEGGVYGMVTAIFTVTVFVFVAFGDMMFNLGGGDMLIKVATAIAGRFRGGPAKVAVVASAFFGTISGAAAANVAATGAFTIPMMKRLGYRPEFAGAVEACASTGGLIMPPVMGVVAFVMADFLGIPYNRLIIYAIIPAVFYFATAFLMVDVEAARTGLVGLPKEEQTRVRDIPGADWLHLVPILVLVGTLLGLWLLPQRAAFWGVTAIFGCSVAHGLVTSGRVDVKRLIAVLDKPARGSLPIISSLACIGLIILAIDVSGLAVKLSGTLVDMAGGNLISLLLLTMLASLVLGMGLPPIACYIFLAMVAAPALVNVGTTPLTAHMFVFYYGVISNITPPVAIAAVVAAGIAQASPIKVALQACRIGIAGLLVPFAFVLEPALLLQGSIVKALVSSAFLLVAAYALSMGSLGFTFRNIGSAERVGLVGAAILMIDPRISTSVAGLALFALVMTREIVLSRRARRAACARARAS